MRAVISHNTSTLGVIASRHLLFGVFIVAWLLLYASTWLSITEEWSFSGALGHGYLVVPFSLYLIYSFPFEYQHKPASLSVVAGLLALIVCCALWWVADKTYLLTLAQLAWLGMFYVACLAYFGMRWLRHHWIAMAILLLAMPFWTYLVQPLRDLSTYISVLVLQWWGMPVFNNGYLIQVPAGSFFVEDSCSGLGFFLVALFLSAAFTGLNRLSWSLGLLVLVISVVTSIVANWIRIIIIIVVGNMTEMQHPIVADHLTFGWFLFVGLLIPLLGFYYYLLRFTPVVKDSGLTMSFSQRPPMRVVSILLGLLLLLPVAYDYSYSRDSFKTYKPRLFEQFSENYRFVSKPLSWQPQFVEPTVEASGQLTVDAGIVDIFAAYYQRELPGKEVVYVKNRLYDDKRWSLGGSEEISIGSSFKVQYAELQYLGQSRGVVYWYDIGGKVATHPLQAKWLALKQYFSREEGAAFIALSSPLTGDKLAAKAQLLANVQALIAADYN